VNPTVVAAEPDRPGVAVLQDGQVDHADADPLGELGQGHAPVGEELVEVDGDGQDRRDGRTAPLCAAVAMPGVQAFRGLNRGMAPERRHRNRLDAAAEGA
jgi:hypothetical protein